MTYKPLLIVPMLVALLTTIGATTTHAYAVVDCSQSDPPRCQQATSTPPSPDEITHHSGLFCLLGTILGIWSPPIGAIAGAAEQTPICQELP
jgi:hypothetical protein